MGRWVGRGVLLSLSIAGSAEAIEGLTIVSDSPDALCPALPVAEQAVARRLGALVVPSGPGWVARYTIAHAPLAEGDFVRLELYEPGGKLELTRELPLESGACGTVAEAMALVLDRYFRRLGGPQDDAPTAAGLGALEGAPSPGPPGTVASRDELAPGSVRQQTAVPRGEVAKGPTDPGPPPERLETPRTGALAGSLPISLWAGVSLPSEGAAAAFGQAFWGVGMGLHVGTELTMALAPERESLGQGVAASRTPASLGLSVVWGPSRGAWRPRLGPVLRLTVERADVTGLPEGDPGTRARASGGAFAGLEWRAGRGFCVGLSGQVEAALGGGRFMLGQREVLEPEAFGARVALGLGYAHP